MRPRRSLPTRPDASTSLLLPPAANPPKGHGNYRPHDHRIRRFASGLPGSDQLRVPRILFGVPPKSTDGEIDVSSDQRGYRAPAVTAGGAGNCRSFNSILFTSSTIFAYARVVAARPGAGTVYVVSASEWKNML